MGEAAYVLIGALSHSGRCRGVFSERQAGPQVIESLDGVLRRLGGTARRWRTDQMAGVVYPGTDRLLPEFVACAKHYGVGVDVCPARRAKRKGVAEGRREIPDTLMVVLSRRRHTGAGADES